MHVDDRMKMRGEHYAHLERAISPLDTEERRAKYRAYDFTAKRYRWDLLYQAKLSQWICDNLYPYLNDDHIDTALRKICGMDRRKEIPKLRD